MIFLRPVSAQSKGLVKRVKPEFVSAGALLFPVFSRLRFLGEGFVRNRVSEF